MNAPKTFRPAFSMTVFFPVVFVILVPLAAEVRFDAARTLADAYLWEKAEGEFEEALRIDPLNAPYFSGYGDFLMSIAPYRENEVALLRKAGHLFERARRLHPARAEYPLKIGEIELRLFLIDQEKYRQGLSAGLTHFREALENDPNGFRVACGIGYDGMEVWPYLDETSRALVTGRLTYVLSQKRWYWEYVYPWAWEHTNDFEVLERIAPPNEEARRDLLYFIEVNNLYQYRRRAARGLDLYTEMQEPERFRRERQEALDRIEAFRKNGAPLDVVAGDAWAGRSDDGNEYRHGDMYWTGTMAGVIKVPPGDAKLILQAKGSPADGVYPYMSVALDMQELGESFVTNDDWKEYTFALKSDGGAKVLSITFFNDGGNEKKSEDRNLYIGEARIVSDGG